MNKQDIYSFLDNRGIWYEVTEHEAVYNMEELAEIELPYPDNDAKNIFVYDDKKVNYYLITTTSKKRVVLKKFRQVLIKYKDEGIKAFSDLGITDEVLLNGDVLRKTLRNDK